MKHKTPEKRHMTPCCTYDISLQLPFSQLVLIFSHAFTENFLTTECTFEFSNCRNYSNKRHEFPNVLCSLKNESPISSSLIPSVPNGISLSIFLINSFFFSSTHSWNRSYPMSLVLPLRNLPILDGENGIEKNLRERELIENQSRFFHLRGLKRDLKRWWN